MSNPIEGEVDPERPPGASPAPPSSRDKILEVAETLFARRGFAGVGMREVAEGVGLGKSSLFHHFPSKLSLYSQVLERVVTHLGERVVPAMSGDEPAAERLERGIDVLIDGLAENPNAPRILMRSLFEDDPFLAVDAGLREPEPFDLLLQELIAVVQSVIAEGIDEGVFHPVPLADTTQTLIGITVYHFASGEFGEALLGESLFSASAVRRRKTEVRNFMRRGLLKEISSE